MNKSKLVRIPKEPAQLINDLKAQLFLLRQSFFNSFSNHIYYKEISNKLRLLVYEKPYSRNYNPLLLILADKYNVKYHIKINIPWAIENSTKVYEFREYLNLFVFGRGNEQIKASQLILDLATQKGGAHEDLTIIEYLKPASAQVKGLPYHLEIIQEISIHTLRYGDLVLSEAIKDYGKEIRQNDVAEEVLAPVIYCDKCNAKLNYSQFICNDCGYSYIPVIKQPPLKEQFEKLFKSSEGVLQETGSFIGWFSIPQLFNKKIGHYLLFDYKEGELNYLLYTDVNFNLVFEKIIEGHSITAKITLNEVKPSDWIMLGLTWSNKLLGLHLGSGGKVHSNEISI